MRETAERNTEKVRKEIRNRLLSKGKVMNKNFEKGTIVISISQIDRYSVYRPLLPCKIVEKTNEKYRLGCGSGILNVTNELNLVEAAEFSELDNTRIPQRTTLDVIASTNRICRSVNFTRSVRIFSPTSWLIDVCRTPL